MATIWIPAPVGAALIGLMAIVPATSQAQAPKAPLQLVPGPDQAKKLQPDATQTAKATRTVAKTSNRSTRMAAARKNERQAAAAPARPSSKTARSTSNPNEPADAMPSRRPGPITRSQTTQGKVLSNAQRARVASAGRAPLTVASPPETILRDATHAPILAQGSDDQASADNTMRDGDSISLVGRLPWWRNDRMQEVQYGSVAAENAVMAAAEAWLAENGIERPPDYTTGQTVAPSPIAIADPGEINEIDLAAGEASPPPTPTFLQSLIALLGSVASKAAASVRFLFV